MTDPELTPPAPDDEGTGAGSAVASSGPRVRAHQGPVARWIRSLPQWLYAALVVAVLVALLLIAVVLNPGDRVGPVQPANPPVGGPGVPAARL